MTHSGTLIKIGQLWNQGRGASYREELDITPDLGSDAHLTKPITADLFLIRMKDGITAILENLYSETELTCSRCLAEFRLPIRVKSTERQFFEETPTRDYDPFEVFLIDRDKMAIDINEMLRQEIILHFPIIPVCSERCKGLCSGCRINLNITEIHLPECKGDQLELSEKAEQSHQPFAKLKDLFKSN